MNDKLDPILLLEYHKELNEKGKFGKVMKGAAKGALKGGAAGAALGGAYGAVASLGQPAAAGAGAAVVGTYGAVQGAVRGGVKAYRSATQDHKKRSDAAKKGWKTRKSHGMRPAVAREGIDPILWEMYQTELNEGVGWDRSNNKSFSTSWTNASMICDLLDQIQDGVGEEFGNYIDHPDEDLPESLAKKVYNLLTKNKSKISMESVSTDPLGRTVKGGMDKFTLSGEGKLPEWATKQINNVIKFCGPPYTNNEDTMMMNVGSEPVQGFGFEQKIAVKNKSDGTFSIVVQEDGQEIEVDTAQSGDEAKELAREYEKMFSSGPFLEEPNFSK